MGSVETCKQAAEVVCSWYRELDKSFKPHLALELDRLILKVHAELKRAAKEGNVE